MNSRLFSIVVIAAVLVAAIASIMIVSMYDPTELAHIAVLVAWTIIVLRAVVTLTDGVSTLLQALPPCSAIGIGILITGALSAPLSFGFAFFWGGLVMIGAYISMFLCASWLQNKKGW